MRLFATILSAVPAVWSCGITCATAEQMPVRTYTIADGLVRDDVACIRRDSHGYLWFGTAEGLSIFDGYQFTNYTVADGLPNRAVTDVLETKSGEYWIATYGGLCRFDPKASPGKHFISYRLNQGAFANQINRLIERRDGSIWFGTEGGLWRLPRSALPLSAERVSLPSREGDALRIFRFAEDRRGILWAASSDGLFAIQPDGRIARIGRSENLPQNFAYDVIEDAQGRIWAATVGGVYRIAPGDRARTFCVAKAYPKRGPRDSPITALFQTTDQKLWAGALGLFQFQPDASRTDPGFRLVAAPSPGSWVEAVGEDDDGNIWIGGPAATKVTRHGFTTFSTGDGLRSASVFALMLDRQGRLCAISVQPGQVTINRFDGNMFVATDSYLPAGFGYAWGDSQFVLQDHAGEWWVSTANGVLRFAPARIGDLSHTPPKRIYSTKDGLPNNIVLRLFEDSRGDVWIGLYRGLARWNRQTDRIEAFGPAGGLPLITDRPAAIGTPLSLAEDRSGAIWIGFHPYGLARYRDRKFRFSTEMDGLPKGQINGLYPDHLGRLWIASSQGGVARIDDIGAARPSFHTYSTAQGLSSNQIFTVVEDLAGRLYLGGGRGVDRLDPAGGTVQHFTAADGLPPVRVQFSVRDRAGALWFACDHGLSRYIPEPDRRAPPPSPLIRRLRIAGREAPVSALGETQIDGLRLGPAQNNLRIEYGSIHFRSGEVLRYQYRLRGVDADWSPPAEERAVNYSGLAPGTYQFVVRAINGDGLVSTRPATIGFVIVPPLWRRPWTIAFEVSLVAFGVYFAHWLRVRQLLQVERIRTRLASDLHDDIGSGLAEIAILSEVAGAQPNSAREIAARVGDRARQLREGMSDIVWSVDPRQRTLAELTGRIRQSAYSMLESDGRRVEFDAPDVSGLADIPVAADRAREALLICREALTNIGRHAGASEVAVRISVQSDVLFIELQDNGRGFDARCSYNGMGIRNLRRRAEETGGELAIDSIPGEGTRVRVRLPLH